MTLPMSTFALGIGHWQPHTIVKKVECITACDQPPNICTTAHDPYPCHVARGDTGPLIPCKIFYSVSAQYDPHPSWLKPGLATNTCLLFCCFFVFYTSLQPCQPQLNLSNSVSIKFTDFNVDLDLLRDETLLTNQLLLYGKY